jgi:DNA-binding response OmpR family regulator
VGLTIGDAPHPHEVELWFFGASERRRLEAERNHVARANKSPGTPRVLFIEDDTSIAEMYTFRLRQDGWQVDIAHDGEEGLAKATARPPDVLILDIMLPGIDGVEVLARLRSLEATRRIPVLVLSNSPGLKAKLQRAQDLGILGWRVKASTTPADLSAQIRSLMK